MKPESLHNHTTDSDGHLTHLEMLTAAEEYGYGVLALTDHDTLPGAETLHDLKLYTGPVKWVIGIEISSLVPKEMNADSGLHILGLFVDPMNAALLAQCRRLSESRMARMRFYVKYLQGLGFKLSETDCMQASGNDFVGSPHIVAALRSHSENQPVIDDLVARMKIAAENNPEVKRNYDRMIEEGEGQYPYALFMKQSSFMALPDEDFGKRLDFDDSVALIRNAGGAAVLAHWFFDKDKLPPEALEKLVQEGRIDGLETEVVNLISQRNVEVESEYLRKLAERNDLITTIGSDAHDDKDLEWFAQSEAGRRSVGQTERLIERVRPDLSWSNFKY